MLKRSSVVIIIILGLVFRGAGGIVYPQNTTNQLLSLMDEQNAGEEQGQVYVGFLSVGEKITDLLKGGLRLFSRETYHVFADALSEYQVSRGESQTRLFTALVAALDLLENSPLPDSSQKFLVTFSDFINNETTPQRISFSAAEARLGEALKTGALTAISVAVKGNSGINSKALNMLAGGEPRNIYSLNLNMNVSGESEKERNQIPLNVQLKDLAKPAFDAGTPVAILFLLDNSASLVLKDREIITAALRPALRVLLDDEKGIEPGSVYIGASPEEAADADEFTAAELPRHLVRFTRPIVFQDHLVTQREYQDLMKTNPSLEWIGDELPVNNVKWIDGVIYCNKKSIADRLTPVYTLRGNEVVRVNWDANGWRLPTNAEWERAARGGTTTPYYTGSSISAGDANFDGRSIGGAFLERPSPAGSYPPNPLGLYQMAGDLWEWVWDIYTPYPDEEETDPTGAVSGKSRVIRGGSWADDARHLRSATRGFRDPNASDKTVGFRIVRKGDVIRREDVK
jgi:formylglycine-generating enzyme required for sulfatase activity